ncbi:dTMP kinase [Chengkuizengella axinellae]|uniref:Deoxynucleoside kinase n=1 Tax=Chengkuizengella axinellae TaxID=3064388 RepID=A0ABT9IZ12_9BACL|nr:deoxynucleoside kinase [Chengkuizengella sp. 2205SS18-9]MDP5274597.1 deoxynucleoside kinase [Chengkuizengella sp. 2205SS18-9]
MEKNDFMINPKKGVLIVYEGISGSGKSKGIAELSECLSKNKVEAKVIEWNSNKRIRSFVERLEKLGILTSSLYSLLQWMSFLIDYFKVISPSLKKNHVVIADRYIFTGITRDAVNGAGKWFGSIIYRFVRKPDVLFFYDTPVQICYSRIQSRGKPLFHTNKALHQNKKINNKEIYYLNEMRNEYIQLFKNHKTKTNTNVFVVNDSFINMNTAVEGYIRQKKSS